MSRRIRGDIEYTFLFGIQDSNAADRFGVTGYVPDELYYYFCKEDLETIEKELSSIRKNMGNSLDIIKDFLENNDSLDIGKLAKILNVDYEKTIDLLNEYADYNLGELIKNCIEKNGKCEFNAEF